VWAKRLERGTFVSDWSTMHTREIDWTQLKLMLEGLVVRAKKYRYQHPESARKAA
jgi:transposase